MLYTWNSICRKVEFCYLLLSDIFYRMQRSRVSSFGFFEQKKIVSDFFPLLNIGPMVLLFSYSAMYKNMV
jgi:hypothetical protein